MIRLSVGRNVRIRSQPLPPLVRFWKSESRVWTVLPLKVSERCPSPLTCPPSIRKKFEFPLSPS